MYGQGQEGAGSWVFLLPVNSLLGILVRQKCFPVSSLQTLTRSQLPVEPAFLFRGITMNSILEPLVTHLLQLVIYRLGELRGRENQGRVGKECCIARWPDTGLIGHLEFLRDLIPAIYVRYRQVSFLCLEAGSFMAACQLGEQKQVTILLWFIRKVLRIWPCRFPGYHSQ